MFKPMYVCSPFVIAILFPGFFCYGLDSPVTNTIEEGILRIDRDASGDITLNGGTLQAGSSFFSTTPIHLLGLSFFDVTGANKLTINGSIDGNGALIKQNTGTLILTGRNSYQGGTAITAGAVSVNADQSLGTGDLSLSNHGMLVATGSFSSPKAVHLAGDGIISVGESDHLAMSGIIDGEGSLTKINKGTLVLTGENSYQKGTRIVAGVVSVGSDACLGAADTGIMLSGGTLQVTNSFSSSRPIHIYEQGPIDVASLSALNISGAIDGEGRLVKQNGGTLALKGQNSYRGGTALLGGILSIDADTCLGDVSGDLTLSGGTLQVINSTTSARATHLLGSVPIAVTDCNLFTMSGSIDGVGSLIKEDRGILALKGNNTYRGATTILSGILRIDADTCLGDASGDITLSGGTLEATDSFTSGRTIHLTAPAPIEVTESNILTLQGKIDGSEALIKKNRGTLVLKGSNTYQGGTTLLGGALSIDADTCLGATTGDITLNGGILQATNSFSSARAVHLTGPAPIDVTDANILTMSGSIDGPEGLIKQNRGTLILKGENTYKGGTTLLEGTLIIDKDSCLGDAAGDLTLNGGTLQASNFSFARQTHLTGQASIAVTDSETLTMHGAIDGKGSLIKQQTGILVLKGNNTYQGGTSILEGTLSIDGDTCLGDASGDLTLSSGRLEVTNSSTSARATHLLGSVPIAVTESNIFTMGGSIDGVGSLIKENRGTLALKGNNTYQGATTILSGTLSIDDDRCLGAKTGDITLNSGTLQATNSFSSARAIHITGPAAIDVTESNILTMSGSIDGSEALIKQNGGTLVLKGSNTYQGGTTLLGGALSIDADTCLGATTGDITLNSGILQATNSFSSPRAVHLTGPAPIDVTDSNRLTLEGKIDGPEGLIKQNRGTLILKGENTYKGGTTLLGGTLIIDKDSCLGEAAGDLNLNGGTLQASNFSFGRATHLTGQGAIAVTDSNRFTMHSTIDGRGGLTKQETGTLVLEGNNSYQGGTTLLAGTLSIDSDSRLGATIGELKLSGGRLEATESFTSTRTTHLVGPATISVTATHILTMKGNIDGAGGLIKENTGMLALGGINTYQGGTTIFNGVLSVDDDTRLGGAEGELTLSGGTLEATKSFTSARAAHLTGPGSIDVTDSHILTLKGSIDGVGSLIKQNRGTLVLKGNNTYQGATSLLGGALSIDADTCLGAKTGDITLSSGTLQATNSFSSARAIHVTGPATIAVTDTNRLTLNGMIDGVGSLIKENTGTLILKGSNTYQGATTILGGALSIDADTCLGAKTGDITLSSGTLQATNSFSSARALHLTGPAAIDVTDANRFTLKGKIDGTGRLIKENNGTLVLTENNTYAGGTSIMGGSLQISADEQLGEESGNILLGGVLHITDSLSSSRDIRVHKVGSIQVDPSCTATLLGSFSGFDPRHQEFLSKSGQGTLILRGENFTYRGMIAIEEGILDIHTPTALGRGRIVIEEGAVLENSSGFPIKIETSNPHQWKGSFTFLGSNDLDLGNGPILLKSDLTAHIIDSHLSIQGTIDDKGNHFSLTKSGKGTWILGGSNTYSGGTNILEGELFLGDSQGLGSGQLTMSDGTTLSLQKGISSQNKINLSGINHINVFSGRAGLLGEISGEGTLHKIGSGTLMLFGNNSHLASTTLLEEGGIHLLSNQGLGEQPLSMSDATTLTLEPDLCVSNGILLSSGTAQMVIPTGKTTFSGTISGEGHLIKAGRGQLNFNGSGVYKGNTYVQEGTLCINGVLHSDVMVGTNSVLAGSGDVHGSVTIYGGTIAPDHAMGRSVGTLGIHGPLTLTPASETSILVQGRENSSIIVDGSATLDGTLQITIDPYSFIPSTEHLILTANEGLNETQFATLNVVPNLFTGYLKYTANSVDFLLDDPEVFDPNLFTGNRKKMAEYIDDVADYLTSENFPLIYNFMTATEQKQKEYLDALSPSRLSFGTYVANQVAFSLASSLSSRLTQERLAPPLTEDGSTLAQQRERQRFLAYQSDFQTCFWPQRSPPEAPHCEKHQLWAQGIGVFSHQNSQQQNPAFDFDAAGILAGYDFAGFEHAIIGGAFGYMRSSLSDAHSLGSGHLNTYLTGPYFIADYRRFFVEGGLFFAYNQIQLKRYLTFPTFDQTSSSTHHNFQLMPHFGLGYEIDFYWGLLEPYATFDYVMDWEEGFTEHGAVPLNMKIDSKFSSMLRSEVGLRAYQKIFVDRGYFQFKEGAAYVNQEPFDLGPITAAFIAVPASFGTVAVESFTENQSLFLGSFQAAFHNCKGWFGALEYQGEFGSGYRSNQIIGTLGYVF